MPSRIRRHTDRVSKRFEALFLSGDSACIINDGNVPASQVYEGPCYVSRRRNPTTPKTDPESRSVTRILNVKLPRSAPDMREGYHVRITHGAPAELMSLDIVVKDPGHDSGYQYCKNLVCEASTLIKEI